MTFIRCHFDGQVSVVHQEAALSCPHDHNLHQRGAAGAEGPKPKRPGGV